LTGLRRRGGSGYRAATAPTGWASNSLLEALVCVTGPRKGVTLANPQLRRWKFRSGTQEMPAQSGMKWWSSRITGRRFRNCGGGICGPRAHQTSGGGGTPARAEADRESEHEILEYYWDVIVTGESDGVAAHCHGGGANNCQRIATAGETGLNHNRDYANPTGVGSRTTAADDTERVA